MLNAKVMGIPGERAQVLGVKMVFTDQPLIFGDRDFS